MVFDASPRHRDASNLLPTENPPLPRSAVDPAFCLGITVPGPAPHRKGARGLGGGVSPALLDQYAAAVAPRAPARSC